MLGSLVTDLLPDLPLERSLLVTAAEADIASELTQRVRNEHVDPGTAVGLAQAIQCNDPGFPNGSIEAYQMNSYASYRTSWAKPAGQPDQCASEPVVSGSDAHQSGPARAPAGLAVGADRAGLAPHIMGI